MLPLNQKNNQNRKNILSNRKNQISDLSMSMRTPQTEIKLNLQNKYLKSQNNRNALNNNKKNQEFNINIFRNSI